MIYVKALACSTYGYAAIPQKNSIFTRKIVLTKQITNRSGPATIYIYKK
jgi:hypothetical protein